MKTTTVIRIFLVITLLVAGTGYYIYKERQKSTPLVFYGNVDIRDVNLAFRVPGRLSKLHVDEGDRVKAGDLLAELDAEPYRNSLAAAEANVLSLRAKLAELEAGFRKEEIAQAQAQVVAREATLKRNENLYKRQVNLITSGAVSQQSHDDALAARDESQAQLNLAQANLDLLNAGYRAEEIAQAQAQLKQAEAQVAETKLQVKDTRLLSVDEGTILTRANEPGGMVAAGATVFTVSLDSPVWIRAFVHEAELGHVASGTKVLIYTDSQPGKAYNGVVGYVSPQAEFTPKTVETAELRTSLVYRFRVVVKDADHSLRQGMPVTVKLAETTSASTPAKQTR
ncbi:MAG: secretion protein HlyD [Puniceicoccales bacterium]|jgi:HlyD family secretion protein|nr:secretion protein HlyD [Puniceicoccales bacterium]